MKEKGLRCLEKEQAYGQFVIAVNGTGTALPNLLHVSQTILAGQERMDGWMEKKG